MPAKARHGLIRELVSRERTQSHLSAGRPSSAHAQSIVDPGSERASGRSDLPGWISGITVAGPFRIFNGFSQNACYAIITICDHLPVVYNKIHRCVVLNRGFSPASRSFPNPFRYSPVELVRGFKSGSSAQPMRYTAARPLLHWVSGRICPFFRCPKLSISEDSECQQEHLSSLTHRARAGFQRAPVRMKRRFRRSAAAPAFLIARQHFLFIISGVPRNLCSGHRE